MLVVEFPQPSSPAAEGSVSWLVLGVHPEPPEPPEQAATAALVVYAAPQPHHSHQLQLVAQLDLPNATFIAVDVTKSVSDLAAGMGSPRFIIDVTAPAQGAGAAGRTSAAVVLEVAGWERGPLLVTTAAGAWPRQHQQHGMFHVWRDVPQDLLHPPQVRSRRRSHKRITTTTTEGYSSAENPVRSAATTGLKSAGLPEEADDTQEGCHLESWRVSVDDLGWDFVAFPREIEINFCVGRCTSLLWDKHYNASTNAIARIGFKSERGSEAGTNIPDAVCVPIRYRPIALLTRKMNNEYDLSTSYDLSADRCGCR